MGPRVTPRVPETWQAALPDPPSVDSSEMGGGGLGQGDTEWWFSPQGLLDLQ